MCGIAFVYSSRLARPELESRMQLCLEKLVHRGPDEFGVYGQDQWIAGHRRLSIIDIATSHQPMRDPSSNYTLVYNGEIYNYQELRSELEHDWNFLTQGDTEVVLAGLCLYGEKFLPKLQGMWAIAFWNNQEKQLFLARDRIGKKPLFYYSQDDSFSCCSEIPSLLHLTPHQLKEDPNSTADYFRYGFYLPGTTAYHQVNEVLPGHSLLWEAGKGVVQKPFWKLKKHKLNLNRHQATEEIQSTFIKSVKKRMVSDVEVGAFLSGGVDSSLVVSTMVNELGITPKTFTIGFENVAYDERHYANLVTKELHTQHFERTLANLDVQQLLTLVLNHHGQPFADASLLPTALASQLAAEHVRVVLSGDGGDELFSGYQRYQAKLIFNCYVKAPAFIRKMIESAVGKLPDPAVHHSRSIIKKAKLFIDSTSATLGKEKYVAPIMCSEHEISNLIPELATKGHSVPPLPELRNEDDVMAMMLMDGLVYLPQDILAKVDRASMAYSLETRTPFLDTDLIELAYSLPRNWHRSGFTGKKLLKQSFPGLLPEAIWKRRKQGFAVPLSQWFRQQLGDQLTTLIDSFRPEELPLQKSVVLQMLNTHRKSRKDYSQILWSIFVYLMWKKKQH